MQPCLHQRLEAKRGRRQSGSQGQGSGFGTKSRADDAYDKMSHLFPDSTVCSS